MGIFGYLKGMIALAILAFIGYINICLLYTSPSPRD